LIGSRVQRQHLRIVAIELLPQPAGETLDFLPQFVGGAVELAQLDQLRRIDSDPLEGLLVGA